MNDLLPITEQEFNKLAIKDRAQYFFTYEQAKAYIRPFQFKSMQDVLRWVNHYSKITSGRYQYRNEKGIYCPKPHFRFPKHPKKFYISTGEWATPEDFLMGVRTKQYAESVRQTTWTYEQAKEFVHKLNLKSQAEYVYWCSLKPSNKRKVTVMMNPNFILPVKPKYLPERPHLLYMKQGHWISWADFLGYDKEIEPNMLRYNYSKEKAINLKIPDMEVYKQYASQDPRMLADPLSYGRRHGLVYKWNDFIEMPDDYDRVKYLNYYHAQALLSLKQIDSVQQYKEYRKEFNIEQFLPPSIKEFYAPKYPNLYRKTDFIKQPIGLKIELQQQFKKCFCVYRNLTNGVRMIVVGKSVYHLLLEMSMTKSKRTEFYFFEYKTDDDHDQLLHDFCTFQGTKNRYYINDFEKFLTACRNRFKEIVIFEYVDYNDFRKTSTKFKLFEDKHGIKSIGEYIVMDKIRKEKKKKDEDLYGEINQKAVEEFGKI